MPVALRSIPFLLCAALSAAPSQAASAVQKVREEALAFGELKVSRFSLAGENGAPVRYYLSQPAAKAPLVLFIQGSGCIPPFLKLDTPQRLSTVFNWLPLAQQGKYAVMVVDKPYQPSAMPEDHPGAAIGCPQAFNDHFSYDSWLATLRSAVRHALVQPTVDAGRVLVIGVSEGGTMAAGLARALPEITNVALIGASGPTQLYDFAVDIYGGKDDDAAKARRLEKLDATFSRIQADPASTSKFAWGHTYLRWSSFMAQSSAHNLAQSRARVYLASGMRDSAVPILSTELMYAQLRAQGRDVRFRRVPLADHGLVPEGGTYAQVQPEYDAIMDWFAGR